MKLARAMRLLLVLLVLMMPPFVKSLQTGYFSPSAVDICGDYPSYADIVVHEIFNPGNVSLGSVDAYLNVPSDAYLGVSPVSVQLGVIYPGNYSSVAPSYTLLCDDSVPGAYTAYINYTDYGSWIASSSGETELIINVHDRLDMQLELISAHNEDMVTKQDRPSVRATTDRDSTCRGRLDADAEYADMGLQFQGTGTNHEYTFTTEIEEGDHTLYVRCHDSNVASKASSALDFSVDSEAPEIVLENSATHISDTSMVVTISTDEDSTCRYSRSDEDFYGMSQFETTGLKHHSQAISGLSQGSNTFYFKCQDAAGNIGELAEVFTVEAPPTAEILLEEQVVLKAGLVNVELVSSKRLREAPQLSYSYDDDPDTSYKVSLEGSGREWTGYLVVDHSEKMRVAKFSFLGHDLYGNQGTEITDGAIFIIDTEKPTQPTSFSATSLSDGSIRLEWFYEGEKIDHFNIYRSLGSGVDYVDLYLETNRTGYTDRSAQKGYRYYYRIAAVDKAFNIGQLSEEASAVSSREDPDDPEPEIEEPKDPPKKRTLEDYNETLKDIEKTIIDVDFAISTLQDSELQDIITVLGLLDDMQETKKELTDIKDKLLGANRLSFTDSELKSLVDQAKLRIRKARITVPKSIELEAKSEIMQPMTQDIVSQAIELLLKRSNLSESDRKEYEKYCAELQEKSKISMTINAITLTLLDESKKKITLLDKSIWYDSPETISDMILIEIIPKEFAQSTQEITFYDSSYEVLEEDPMVSWTIPEFSYNKIRRQYSVDLAHEAEAKSIVTVPLKDPGAFITASNRVTGLSIANVSNQFSKGQLYFFVVAIVVACGLLVYYIGFVRDGSLMSMLPLPMDPAVRTLAKRLNRAHEEMAQLNVREAKRNYDEIRSEMGVISFKNEKQKTKHTLSFEALHNKLLLYSRISQAYEHLESRSYEQFQQALAEITEIYRDLKAEIEGTKLNNFTQRYHNYFLAQISKIRGGT